VNPFILGILIGAGAIIGIAIARVLIIVLLFAIAAFAWLVSQLWER
jgi:hypothetical protein